MKEQDIYQEIVKDCESFANPELVRKYARYFKEGYDAWGLTSDQIKEIAKKVEEMLPADEGVRIRLCELLVQGAKYEETIFAIHLIRPTMKNLTLAHFKQIEKWYQIGIKNWAHSDVLCGDFFKRFLLEKIIELKDLEPWKIAVNKFQRRAVPVAMLHLLKTDIDFDILFTYIDSMMMDSEREVHQGLGWFLREAWKLQRQKTETFLLKWKNKAPRLIFQYATEKMTKEEKLRFKKEKLA